MEIRMMLSTDADDFRILRPLFNSPPRAGEERRSIRAKNRGSRLVIAGLVPRSRSDRSPDGAQRHPRRPSPEFAALNLGRLPLRTPAKLTAPSKYPPAKPGALMSEPLKAAWRGQ